MLDSKGHSEIQPSLQDGPSFSSEASDASEKKMLEGASALHKDEIPF